MSRDVEFPAPGKGQTYPDEGALVPMIVRTEDHKGRARYSWRVWESYLRTVEGEEESWWRIMDHYGKSLGFGFYDHAEGVEKTYHAAALAARIAIAHRQAKADTQAWTYRDAAVSTLPSEQISV